MTLPSANPTRNELYPNSPQDKNDLSNPINSPARLPATMAMTPWTATRVDCTNIPIRMSKPLNGLFWKYTCGGKGKENECFKSIILANNVCNLFQFHTKGHLLTCAIPRNEASANRIMVTIGAGNCSFAKYEGKPGMVPLIFLNTFDFFFCLLLEVSALSESLK